MFHRLSQAVKRMMGRKEFNLLTVYLDDILIMAELKEACAQAPTYHIQLLKELGFAINWRKGVDPTNITTFLGIKLDSLTMSLSLPEDNITMFRKELHSFL